MGTLKYDGELFPFDDRVLAHLQIVMSAKLRRSENFFLTWMLSPENGSGRHSIWVDNGIPIHFTYNGSRLPQINRDWVEKLAESANSNFGLVVSPETVDHLAAGAGPAT